MAALLNVKFYLKPTFHLMYHNNRSSDNYVIRLYEQPRGFCVKVALIATGHFCVALLKQLFEQNLP